MWVALIDHIRPDKVNINLIGIIKMFENLKAFLISVVPYERAIAIIEALVTLKATGTPGMEQFVSETLAMVDGYDNYTIVDFIGEYTLQSYE
jgi:NADH:ubiquinone oxidoreductase subunit 4 (subunit M)